MLKVILHLNRFWALLGKFRLDALIFVVVALVAALLDGIGLSMIIPILDTIINGKIDSVLGSWFIDVFGDVSTNAILITSAFFLVFTLFLKELFSLWQIYFTTKFSLALRNHWREQIGESLLWAEEGTLSEDRRGALLDLVVNQTQNASKFVQFSLKVITDFVFIIVMFFIMIAISWKVTIITVLLFGFTTGVTYLPLKKYAGKLGRKAVALALRVSSTVQESLAGLRELKVNSLESSVINEISLLSEQQAKLRVREKILTRLPWTTVNLLVAMMVLLGVVYFGTSSSENAQTLLPVVALFVLVGQRLSNHFASFMSNWIGVQTLYPSLLLVMRTLQSSEPIPQLAGSTEATIPSGGEIRFDNVSFGYGLGPSIITRLNTAYEPSVVTAVVGPSGSGKSTIADLLLALRRPTEGKVLYNGKDLNSIDVTTWRKNCAYVSQRPFLFSGSVLDNIQLGWSDAGLQEIYDAARRAHADQFIRNLKDGYDTFVGEGGANLSGGQAQRLTIARALLRDPVLIVFDEPTSALDKSSRNYLLETFRSLAKAGKIVVIMTHDPVLIKEADRTHEIGRIIPTENETVGNTGSKSIGRFVND